MPYDLSEYLVVGVSSRALFDLRTEDEIFEKQGLEAYTQYQIAHEEEILRPGAGFGLVRAILSLNRLVPDRRVSEVIIMSRNSADTSLRIFNSIRHYGLDIGRAALTSGASLVPYLRAFEVDLFLSAHEKAVQAAVDAGVAAAQIYPTPPEAPGPEEQIRIAFDGDAVLFSEESELIYQSQGLDAFQAHEEVNARKPLPEGPFAKLLTILSLLQREHPDAIRTALVTSRGSPAHERVIRTLRAWDVRIDEAFFLGGAPKHEILTAFGPHIYFDDQDVHIRDTSAEVAVARVPHPNGAAQQLEIEGLPPAVEPPGRRKGGKGGKKRASKKKGTPVVKEASPVPASMTRDPRPARRGARDVGHGPSHIPPAN